jgi:hypothetical protein
MFREIRRPDLGHGGVGVVPLCVAALLPQRPRCIRLLRGGNNESLESVVDWVAKALPRGPGLRVRRRRNEIRSAQRAELRALGGAGPEDVD